MASPLRRRLVAVLILGQLAVLGFMAGKREYVRAFGHEVYLATAPIDPRDPFRGDFVRLRYPFSVVAAADLRDGLATGEPERDLPVYAVLRPLGRGVYVFDHLTDRQPAAGVYLRGRLESRRSVAAGEGVAVRYGIEQYFVQQGRGRAIEARRGRRGGLQVPLEVRVALGGEGTGVIKDFRWSPLGIALEVVRSNRRGRDGRPENPDQPVSPAVRLTLQNVSDTPLTLRDPTEPCALVLETVRGGPDLLPPDDGACPAAKEWIELAPDAAHTLELDLSEPRWHVLQDGTPMEMGALERAAMFRLTYRSPPEPGSTANHWAGELSTPAFNAFGRVD